MKISAKKHISVLMALVMVLTVFSGIRISADAVENDTAMVYFENTRQWGPIYCYYWSDANTQMTAWPGEQMHQEASAYYSLEIPAQAQYVIFTDCYEQTADLKFPGNGYLYSCATDTWVPYTGCVHSWDEGRTPREPNCTTEGYTIFTCTLCGDTYQVKIPALGHDYDAGICLTCGKEEPDAYTLYFRNTEGWEQVRFYCWNGDYRIAPWPGEVTIPMGDDVYLARVPYAAQYIIFNDGAGNQTADLIIPGTGSYIYDPTVGDWHPYDVTCEHVLHFEEAVTVADCTHDGLDRYVCTLCGETVEMTSPAVGHDYADGICTRCGDRQETAAVYFDLGTGGWQLVYYYWWTYDSNIGAWPGALMKPVGDGVYCAEVPADISGIIFTNGRGDQTEDLRMPGDEYIYDLDSGEWTPYTSCDHQWEGGTCVLCGKKNQQTVTIYFNHAFQYCDGLNVRYSGSTMDTVPMEHVGGTVYRAQVPADASVWFRCDCGPVGYAATIPGDGYILYPAKTRWELYNGCAHEWDEGQVRDEWTCEQDEVTVYSCLHCDEEFEMYRTAYGHNYVDCVCQNCGREVPQTITLYLSNAEDWESAYVYIWNKNEHLAMWPGLQMEKAGEMFRMEIPGNYQYIMFNDGHDLTTEELLIPGDRDIYDWESGSWVTLPKEPVLGDGNGDGSLDILDVAVTYTYVKNNTVPKNINIAGLDVNGDGELNIVDVAMMYAHVKGTRTLW